MTTVALFAVAALTFSLLAGAIDGLRDRRVRRRLQGSAWPVLHPLTHHGFRRVQRPVAWRVLHHVGLFFGFLFSTYVGLLVVKAVRSALVIWF